MAAVVMKNRARCISAANENTHIKPIKAREYLRAIYSLVCFHQQTYTTHIHCDYYGATTTAAICLTQSVISQTGDNKFMKISARILKNNVEITFS